jgi:two-component system, NtrC family, nitrogen regulation sensor histidine kinase NtrY
MGLRSRFRRHRQDNRLIIGGLGLLLLLFTAAFYFLLNNRDLERELITNKVLLFFLWNANLLLILTVLFVLLRLLLKLMVERKHRILGSKFKTKLIATYIGLSLFPVLLLFFFANQLVSGSIDRWFNVDLQELVQKAQDVSAAYNEQVFQVDRHAAARVLEVILESDEPLESRTQLGPQLQTLLTDSGVDLLAIYEGRDFIRGVINPESGLADFPETDWSFLTETISSGQADRVRVLAAEDRLMLSALAGQRDEAEAEAVVVVIAGMKVGASVANKLTELHTAYLSHRQAVVLQKDIKTTHLLLFLMATLLILLACSWVGLYLARQVTVPIEALAAGTRRISSGDLTHRVDIDAGDELGVLVTSFNQMTAELERNRKLLQERNQELIEANRLLTEERALIGAVLQNVAAGVVSLDSKGAIFTCNGAARSMLRLREDIRGKTPAEAWPDAERSRLLPLLVRPEEVADGALATISRRSQQVELVLKGEWKTFEVTVTPMHGVEGQLMGQVMVLEDLTELIKAQKLAAWTEAARRIAHEIKNPLTPIKLSAERLLRKHRQGDAGVGSALEEAVEIIVREVGTMQNLVDEFSRYARMPQPQPEEVDLARLIQDTMNLYRDVKPGVEVAAELSPDTGPLYLDGNQMKQALINLMDNAVEATEAPGTIHVSTERANGVIRIHVADTGRGIPQEAKEKLFLPYFSTKGRGTGLGLAIVHRIVSDHHGHLRVEDNKPHGSIFTVELPAR